MNNLPISKYVIIGSYPLGIRYSKDIDIICYKKDVQCEYSSSNEFSGSFLQDGRKVELLFADNQESFQYILANHDRNEAAEYWELWGIKYGHINYPHRQWKKHIHDLHLLEKLLYGHKAEAEYVAKLHSKATKERLGKQRLPSLKGVTKDQFFDDAVVKYYIHDDIHRSIAHKEKPMYEYMQRDTSIVECDKDLWDAFPVEDKIKTVLEECYTIALERHIIPQMKGSRVGLRQFEAFEHSLMRVCTNLCSGFFRQFAIDNYFTILNQYSPDFVEKFQRNIVKYDNKNLIKS